MNLRILSILLLIPYLANAENNYEDVQNEFSKHEAYIEWQLPENLRQDYGLSYAFSEDKARLAIYEAIEKNTKKNIENNLVAISIWDTVSRRLIKTTRYIANERATIAYQVNMKFSKDNKLLVLGLPAGLHNMTWNYEVGKAPVKSCFSYMGTTIDGVSEDGTIFMASTEDGLKLLCDSNKGEELFLYHPAPSQNIELTPFVEDIEFKSIDNNKLIALYTLKDELVDLPSDVKEEFPMVIFQKNKSTKESCASQTK